MIESRRSFGLGAWLGALLWALVGCGGDDDDGHTHGAGIGAAGAYAPVPCPADTPEFAAGPAGIGLEALGVKQAAQVRVIDAMPRAPERYENDWSVAFLDAQGAPLADAQVASACAFMPVHGHFEAARMITPLMEPGTFQLKALNLSMVGPWEVHLTINSPTVAGTADQFTKCDTQRRTPGAELIVLRTCVKEK
jgi:hypothetical protein